MAELLGLGLTHSPSLIRPDEDGESSLKRTLRTNDRVPAELKNPTNWPEPMRVEFGEDEGYAAAVRLRERMVPASASCAPSWTLSTRTSW